MVQSCVSRDGQFVISGSEDGKPLIWDIDTDQPLSSKAFECKLLDLVSDCTWNNKYNMFAISGFGRNFPVLIYVYERTDKELTHIMSQRLNISSIDYMGKQKEYHD
jgi:WD40 repeat protein